PERDRYAELIPEDVRAIIDRGMQVDRETRFQTGEALATELERALRSRAPARVLRERARRRRLLAARAGDGRDPRRDAARGVADARGQIAGDAVQRGARRGHVADGAGGDTAAAGAATARRGGARGRRRG